MAKATEVVEVHAGNPKKKNNPPAEPMGIRLPPELRSDMQAICERDGVPMATFIKDAVQERMLVKKPELARRALTRTLALAAAQFEVALKLGVLADTEAEKDAEGIRQFFGEFLELLKDVDVQLLEEDEDTNEDS